MDVIESKAQEYGMKAFEVVEYNTSKYCAYHDVEVARNPRGVISCPKGHKLRSDLNGALNILKKAANVTVSMVKKPPSFIVDHNLVAPAKGCNPRGLGEPSPFRAGRRSVSFGKRLDEKSTFFPTSFLVKLTINLIWQGGL